MRTHLVALLALTACGRSSSRATSDVPGFVTRVETIASLVTPGQKNIPVLITLTSADSATLLEVGLRFRRGSRDVGVEYDVIADSGNAMELTTGGTATHLSWVTVRHDASPGPVLIDATLRAVLADGTELRDTGGQPATWEVLAPVLPTVLMVTVTTDEDDTGGVPTVAAAGGADDVSLREALQINRGAGEPHEIRFDPAVFPPGAPATIVVGASLPTINQAYTRIDASDAGVILDGSSSNRTGLTVAADDVTIRGLTVTGFDDLSYRCLVKNFGYDRFTLVDCTFSACAHLQDWGGAQVIVSGGEGHIITGNRFERGGRDGLGLHDLPSGVLVANNELVANGDDGATFNGSGHVIVDNLFEGNDGSGIEGFPLTGVVLRTNRFIGNGLLLALGTGTHGFAGEGVDLLFDHCTFIANPGIGIQLSENTAGATVSQCTFEGNGEPIALAEGANEAAQPPEVTSFDGVRVEGRAATTGTVEVYDAGTAWTWVADAVVTDGAWAVTLPAQIDAVAATVTTPFGSTSEFSGVVAR